MKYEALAACAYVKYVYTNLVKVDYHLAFNMKSGHFSLSFLVPTVCRLPPWTIALIELSAIALGIAIQNMIGAIILWLSVFYRDDEGESVAPI